MLGLNGCGYNPCKYASEYRCSFSQFHLIVLLVDNVTHTKLPPDDANTTSIPEFNMRTSFLRCRIWESDKEQWSQGPCKVSIMTRLLSTY